MGLVGTAKDSLAGVMRRLLSWRSQRRWWQVCGGYALPQLGGSHTVIRQLNTGY